MVSVYLIAGLGNPGREYENTRHNTGFSVIDVIAEKNGIVFSERRQKGLIGKGTIEGERVMLVKPQTFMNLSGECLRGLTEYYKIDERTRLIVIYDDVNLDVGQLRIRKKGSAGGHNGIKNIIAHMGHDVFQRIKVGIGKKPDAWDMIDYVLGHFNEAERKKIAEGAVLAEKAVRLMVQGKTDAAMNAYNQVLQRDQKQEV